MTTYNFIALIDVRNNTKQFKVVCGDQTWDNAMPPCLLKGDELHFSYQSEFPLTAFNMGIVPSKKSFSIVPDASYSTITLSPFQNSTEQVWFNLLINPNFIITQEFGVWVFDVYGSENVKENPFVIDPELYVGTGPGAIS